LNQIFPEESTDEENIWGSKGKPTARDVKATEHFLGLRQKYATQFDDKKTCKTKLWAKMATEMEASGYPLGPGGGEKCRQKFQNLFRLYLKHRQYVRKTGTGKRDPPHYYELMHSIMGNCLFIIKNSFKFFILIGGKHKVNPQNIQDDETVSMEPTASTSAESSTSSDPRNRDLLSFKLMILPFLEKPTSISKYNSSSRR
jgi:hypothetical protein